MRRIGFLLLMTACHEAGTPVTDGPTGTDVSTATPGLYVSWRANPLVPGALTDRLTVTDVTFFVDRFEVLSDVNEGTSHSRYALTWTAGIKPSQEMFLDASPGVYSQVAITLGGGFSQRAYEIRGTWRDNSNTTRRFKIDDRLLLKTSLDLSETLTAGGIATIGIAVQLQEAIEGIDFRRLQEHDGELELETGDLQLNEFRGRLKTAFKLDHDRVD